MNSVLRVEEMPILKVWRWLVILALYAVPVAVFFTVGVMVVWRSGQYWWCWWLAPLCWVVAYLLTRVWRKRLAPPVEADFAAPEHWTGATVKRGTWLKPSNARSKTSPRRS